MIATARLRWTLTIAVIATLYGVFSQQQLLVQLAIACLLWIGAEWIVFRYRADFLLRQLTARREVSDRKGTARVLWVDRAVDVTVEIELPGRFGWPLAYADIRDLLPTSTRLIHGDGAVQTLIGRGQSVTISYRVQPTIVGAIRFVGLRIVLCDLHGFFQAERFWPLPATHSVLPQPTEAGLSHSLRKRHNELPPPGTHIVSRPGVGSELLEIRDYVPGDSPRSIAWKVSARRDALMSKQYESEVPVRCHLLVDLSRSVRVGYPGPCPARRFANIAATVAQMMSLNRDPVGLTLLAGDHVSITRPSAHRQTVLRMLDVLAKGMDASVPPVPVAPDEFLKPAFDVARKCCPQSLHQAEAMLGGLRLFPRRSKTRMRLQLAAVLADYYQLPLMALGELVENSQQLSCYLQQFLASHGVPYAGPLVDEHGRYLFEDGEKIALVADLITRAVAKGRDNELFVLMAGLLNVEYQLQPLLRAIRVAIARHHRVVVLCAWPPQLEPPQELSSNVLDRMTSLPPDELASAAYRQQQTAAYQRLRRELGRLRVPVVAATDTTATRLILSQMELVRGGRVMT